MRLNSRGFSFIELLVAVFVISLVAIMVLNYAGIQEDAFHYKDANDKMFRVVASELEEIYSAPDWSVLTKDEETQEGVLIQYLDYNITDYNTESLKLIVKYSEKEWVYNLERKL